MKRCTKCGSEKDLEAFPLDACVYCPAGAFECLDHVVPLSRGGAHCIENLVPACASCNLRKGSMTLFEFIGREAA